MLPVYQIIAIVGGSISVVAALAAIVFGLMRSNSWKSISSEWKELATARLGKIGELEKRVTELEKKLTQVMAENEELRDLNRKYQAQLMARGTVTHDGD